MSYRNRRLSIRLRSLKRIEVSALCAAFMLALPLFLGGCQTAQQHVEQVRDDTTERVTVGTVQREIRVGMSGSQVIEVLDSPNIVSTDENRNEVWIYDKISTEYVRSSSEGGGGLILGGILGSDGVGGLGLSSSASAGAASTSQRTFTVIIKFDAEGKVRDFAYHTSRF